MGKATSLLQRLKDEVFESVEPNSSTVGEEGTKKSYETAKKEAESRGIIDEQSSEKTTSLADGIVKEAYSNFHDPSAKKLYRIESISKTIKVPNTAERNVMVRELLTQFGESLEELRDEALSRSDFIKKVQREFSMYFEKESQDIENEIEIRKKEIEVKKQELEKFIKATNQDIERLSKLREDKESTLKANIAGAEEEIKRLSAIMEVLTEEG